MSRRWGEIQIGSPASPALARNPNAIRQFPQSDSSLQRGTMPSPSRNQSSEYEEWWFLRASAPLPCFPGLGTSCGDGHGQISWIWQNCVAALAKWEKNIFVYQHQCISRTATAAAGSGECYVQRTTVSVDCGNPKRKGAAIRSVSSTDNIKSQRSASRQWVRATPCMLGWRPLVYADS